jgi:hypothetical protein
MTASRSSTLSDPVFVRISTPASIRVRPSRVCPTGTTYRVGPWYTSYTSLSFPNPIGVDMSWSSNVR